MVAFLRSSTLSVTEVLSSLILLPALSTAWLILSCSSILAVKPVATRRSRHSASWRGGTHVHAQCGHVHVHVHVVHVGGVRDMHILRMQFTGTRYASVCSCDCALRVL